MYILPACTYIAIWYTNTHDSKHTYLTTAKLKYLTTAYYTPNDGFTATDCSVFSITHVISKRYYQICFFVSLLPSSKKRNVNWGKNFSVKIDYK